MAVSQPRGEGWVRPRFGRPLSRRCDELAQLQIVNPGGVAQKVGDASLLKPLHFRDVQLGDVVDERTVQSDQAVFDEAHHGGRGDRLRAGRDRKAGDELKTLVKKRSKLILTILSPNPFPLRKVNRSRLAKISIVSLGNRLGQLATILCTLAQSPIKPGALFAARTACRGLSIGHS